MVANDGIANLQKSYTENLKFFFCAKIMYPCPVPPIWLLIFKGGCTLGVCSVFALCLLCVCSWFARGSIAPLWNFKKGFFLHYIPLQRSPSDRIILFYPPPLLSCAVSLCSLSVRFLLCFYSLQAFCRFFSEKLSVIVVCPRGVLALSCVCYDVLGVHSEFNCL